MNKTLKNIFDQTCDLFNIIDKNAEIMKKAGAGGELADIFRYELLAFLMCLSSVDGRISRVEAQLIRDYFELDYYPIHIKQALEARNIGSDEFFSRVPESLNRAVEVDNAFIKETPELENGIGDVILELFKIFGKEMIVADEKVKAEEQGAWSLYITMMTQYIAENSMIWKTHAKPSNR